MTETATLVLLVVLILAQGVGIWALLATRTSFGRYAASNERVAGELEASRKEIALLHRAIEYEIDTLGEVKQELKLRNEMENARLQHIVNDDRETA